jgi:hypothetical protein
MPNPQPIRLTNAEWQEFEVKHRKSRPTPISPKAEARNQQLAELQKLWRQVQGARRRDAIYGYLRRIFELVRHWKDRGRCKQLVQYVQEFAGTEIDRRAEIYSTLIKATTDADSKAISKFSRVLRYCERAKPKDEGLKRFIKHAGGLNACANQFTEILGQPRPRARSPKARRLIRK